MLSPTVPAQLAFRMAGIPVAAASSIISGTLALGRVVQPHLLAYIDSQTGQSQVESQSQNASTPFQAGYAAGVFVADSFINWYVEN